MRLRLRIIPGCRLLLVSAMTCAAITPTAMAQYYPQQYVSISGVAESGSVSFPATASGSSTTQTVQFTTPYSTIINSITVPPSVGGKQEFTVGPVSGCVIDGVTNNVAGSVCKVSVTFSPAYAGVRSLPLVVDVSATFGGSSGTYLAYIGLSGTGLAPLAVVTPGTATLLQAGLATPSYQYLWASGMAVDGAGNTYAAITRSGNIVEIDKDTAAISNVSTGISYPQAVAVDAIGTVYIGYANVVIKVRSTDGTDIVANEEDGYGGAYGFSGDGGPAYLASFSGVEGLALDPAGNVYISDSGNGRIRVVNANTQIITTYAGGGTTLGDGGPATSAMFSSPFGIATDSVGNLYIADSGNNRIRKVTASTGIVTTVAGNGTAGYTGDNGPATAAELNGPLAIALDAAGNLYITDSGNNVIRKVDAATNTIYTLAGGTTALTAAGQTLGATNTFFARPSGVAVDPLGNLLVSSSANSQIFKIAATAGTITFPQQTLVNAPDTVDDPQKFYLSNDGTQPFSITVPTSGTNPALPSGFSVDNASACQSLLPSATAITLATGSTCLYGLDFTPTTTGTNTGTLTVIDSAPGSPQTMNLSGTGGTATSTTTSLTFGSGADVTPVYTSTDTLTATVAHASVGATSPISGTVTFYADGTVLPNGSNVVLTNGVASVTFTQLLAPGNHTFTATFTPGGTSNLDPSTSSALSVGIYKASPGTPSVVVDNHIYDGNPHGVTVTTSPPNLPTSIYYYPIGSSTGSTTPPTLPGVYTAEIYIAVNSPDFLEISTSLYLHIYPLPATVTVNSLSVPFGSAVPAPIVTTTPAGLTTVVKYSGSATPPTAIGQYLLSASVTTPGYAGYADGILEIYSPTLTASTWIVNQDSTVSHLNASGSVLSTAGTASGTSTLGSIAIDAAGDAWAVTNANNSVVEVSPTGTLLGTYSGGGLLAPVSVAIDGLGKPWVVNSGNSLTVFSTSGTALSPGSGFLSTSAAEATTLATPSSIAIDRTGSVWITNSGDSSITRVFGAAPPVIAPTSSAVAGSTLGVRP